jgi:uncharacterized protein (DUF779 family)
VAPRFAFELGSADSDDERGTVLFVHVTATTAAERVVERAKTDRPGSLVFTIGTGCCESTAPFLYEDFWPGPDQETVGEVAGVPVFAPDYLRALYSGTDGVVIDVEEGLMAESLSIETEYECRFVLRDPNGIAVPGQETTVCTTDSPVSALRTRGAQELPEALRRARMR